MIAPEQVAWNIVRVSGSFSQKRSFSFHQYHVYIGDLPKWTHLGLVQRQWWYYNVWCTIIHYFPCPCLIDPSWTHSAYLFRLYIITPNFLKIAMLPWPDGTCGVQPVHEENRGSMLLLSLRHANSKPYSFICNYCWKNNDYLKPRNCKNNRSIVLSYWHLQSLFRQTYLGCTIETDSA